MAGNTEFVQDCTEVEENNTIVICVDTCEHSLRAFNWYMSHFHQKQHQLCLVHVYVRPETTHHEEETYNTLYAQYLDEELRKSALVTEKFHQLCKQKGVQAKMHSLPRVESIGATICKFAKEKDAGCVVLGQRGLGAVKVFGSASEYVLHNLNIPVLIVPSPNGNKRHVDN